MIVYEPEFRERFTRLLNWYSTKAKFGCVTGPGRSGAVAAVYASHILRIPFLPYGQTAPECLRPVLVVDTATNTGRTLRRACRRYDTAFYAVGWNEEAGGRVRFWYETDPPQVLQKSNEDSPFVRL